MKIGYLLQAGVPDLRKQPLTGPANHVKHVFSELCNLGHEITLLANFEGKIWKSDDLINFEVVSMPWVDQGALRTFERIVRRLQYELQLPYIAFFDSLRFTFACRKELSDCDLFYERMGWMGFGGAVASRVLGIPLVLEVNGDHLSEMEALGIPPLGMQRWLSIMLTRIAIKQPTYIIATGEGWRQSFIKRWGTKSEKVIVVENGTEVVKLLERGQLSSFLEVQDPQKPTSIIYVGAFEPWHGITVFIKAMARAIEKRSRVKLLLIGDGTESNKIKELIHELDMESLITMTGHLSMSQILPYLANSDIGVSPYCGRVEYSGLKLLDYKAAGLAIIASGEKGQPAVIEHMRTGWVVPPCDENGLCDAIVELVNNVELRIKLGREARIDAENHHSWWHTAKELESICWKVVSH